MKPSLRTLLASAAIAIPAMGLAACGGVPGNAVATVDGNAIPKTAYDHWLSIAARSSGATTSVPDAPDFTKCVSELRKSTAAAAATPAAAAKGKATPTPAATPTDAALRTQCETQLKTLREQAMQFLISYRWIAGEAEERKVSVSDKDVAKRLADIKKEQFAQKGSFEKFLKQYGYSAADVEMQVRLELLSNKISEAIVKGKDTVTAKEISDYYNKHKETYATPETRDLRVVLTKTKDKADAARTEIDGGAKWADVAKKYSVDDTTKAAGGVLKGVAKGSQDEDLDKAVFSATKGKVTGPVKTEFGFYVFEVTKVTEGKQQTLKEATPVIKSTLQSEKQTKARNAFVSDFTKRWTEKTDCRAGYTVTDCKNGPKATPAPAGAPGGTTGTAPQQ